MQIKYAENVVIFVQKTGQTGVMLKSVDFAELLQSSLVLSAWQVAFQPLGRCLNKAAADQLSTVRKLASTDGDQVQAVILQCTYTAFGAFSLSKIWTPIFSPLIVPALS